MILFFYRAVVIAIPLDRVESFEEEFEIFETADKEPDGSYCAGHTAENDVKQPPICLLESRQR